MEKWIHACIMVLFLGLHANGQDHKFDIMDYAGFLTKKQEDSLRLIYGQNALPVNVLVGTINLRVVDNKFLALSGSPSAERFSDDPSRYYAERFYERFVKDGAYDMVFFTIIPPTKGAFQLSPIFALSFELPGRTGRLGNDPWLDYLEKKMNQEEDDANDIEKGWAQMLSSSKVNSESIFKGFEYILQQVENRFLDLEGIHASDVSVKNRYYDDYYSRLSPVQINFIKNKTDAIHDVAETVWAKHRKLYTNEAYGLDYEDATRITELYQAVQRMKTLLGELENGFSKEDHLKSGYFDTGGYIHRVTRPRASQAVSGDQDPALSLAEAQQWQWIEAEIKRQLERRQLTQIISEMYLLEKRSITADFVLFKDYMDLPVMDFNKQPGKHLYRYELKILGGVETGIGGFLLVMDGTVLYQHLRLSCQPPHGYLKGWEAEIRVLTADLGASRSFPIPTCDGIKSAFNSRLTDEFLNKLGKAFELKNGLTSPVFTIIPPSPGAYNGGESYSPFYYPPEYFLKQRGVFGAAGGSSVTIGGVDIGQSGKGESFMEIGDLFFLTHGWAASVDYTKLSNIWDALTGGTATARKIEKIGYMTLSKEEAGKTGGFDQKRIDYYNAIKSASGISAGMKAQFGSTVPHLTRIITPKQLDGKVLETKDIAEPPAKVYPTYSVAMVYYDSTETTLSPIDQAALKKVADYVSQMKGNLNTMYAGDSVVIDIIGNSFLSFDGMSTRQFNALCTRHGVSGGDLAAKKTALNLKIAQARAATAQAYINSNIGRTHKVKFNIITNDKGQTNYRMSKNYREYLPPASDAHYASSPYYRSVLALVSLCRHCELHPTSF